MLCLCGAKLTCICLSNVYFFQYTCSEKGCHIYNYANALHTNFSYFLGVSQVGLKSISFIYFSHPYFLEQKWGICTIPNGKIFLICNCLENLFMHPDLSLWLPC